RGMLFGCTESRDIARELKSRRVDALWLGANPRVPRSLANILNPRSGKGDFADFERQKNSGFFSSCKWDDSGRSSTDWNPIQEPRRRWSVYRDVLARLFGSADRLTMANCIPWGSKTMPDFLANLGAKHPELLQRALSFADDLNASIICAI